MRVPVYERREGIIPLPANNVSPLMPAGDGGSSMLEAAKGLTLKLQQMQNDTEDARTLELFNKFKRDSLEYHENPDKGLYNTRLGYHSQGVYGEADQWLRQTGEDYVKGLKSSRAKANFRKMAEQYIQQRGIQNSRFEADQMKKYQTEQADATIKNMLNYAEANWSNPKAINEARQNIYQALELKTRGLGEETFKEEVAKNEDKIGSAIIRQAYAENPDIALSMLNDKNIYLHPENKAKLKISLEKKIAALHKKELENAQYMQYRNTAQSLMQKFPEGQEHKAYEWINANLKNKEDIEGVTQQFNALRSQDLVRRKNEKDALTKQQKENFSALEKQYYDNYQIVPIDILRQQRDNNDISDTQYKQALQRNGLLATRAGLEKQFEITDPLWNTKSLYGKDVAIMQARGISEDDHKIALNYLKGRILSGEATDAEINSYFENFLITTNEREYFKDFRKNLSKTHTQAIKTAQTSLKTAIDALKFSPKDKPLYKMLVVNEFNDLIEKENISADDPKYNDKIKKAAEDAIQSVVTMSGKSTQGWFWGLTNFGEKVQNTMDMIKNLSLPETQDIFYEPLPPLPSKGTQNLSNQRTKIPISDLPEIQGEVDLSRAFAKGNFRVTSGYSLKPTKLRNGRSHRAIDIGMPENTSLHTPNNWRQWEVLSTGNQEGKAGKYVKLSTTNSYGDNIVVTLAHLNSIDVKKGDILSAGEIFAKSGNTGNSTAPHLHVKVEVNGKIVNPLRVDFGFSQDQDIQQPSVNTNINTPNLISDDIPTPEEILFGDWGLNGSEDIF